MDKSCCEREKEHALAVQRAQEEVMPSADVEKLCGVFRMLADPTRMKIVLALLKGDMCVYHLAEVTNSTVSNVSHQLRALREHKIVKAERLGKNVEYSIADGHIERIVEMGVIHLTCEREEEV